MPTSGGVNQPGLRPQYFDEILEHAGQEAVNLVKDSADLEKLSKAAETAKTLAEAREANFGLSKFLRWTKWFASLATSLTLILALATFFLQNRQYRKSEELQRASEEGAHWREAMKAVSFEEPSRALTAAIWMESFFDSEFGQYRELSRRVTATLLPVVEDVAGFDSVLTNLVKHTKSENQIDVIDVALKVSAIQWGHYVRCFGHRPNAPKGIPFVKTEVLDIELVHKRGPSACGERDFAVGAWKLDTASHGLWRIWVGNKLASPKKQYLVGVILENTGRGESFSADFTNANLRNSVLFEASFQGANLTGTNLTKVIILDDVDLTEITQFEGSDWTDTPWWKARRIAPALCKYLRDKFAAPRGTNLPAGCES